MLSRHDPRHRDFLKQYKDVFVQKDEFKMSSMNVPPLKLNLKHETVIPTAAPARRRYSARDEADIDIFIENGMLRDLIRKCKSSTVSPLVVIRTPKKTRICIDSRVVNKTNAGSLNYTFPRIEDEVKDLSAMGYTDWFQCDALGAYNQVELDEKSQELLAFPCWTRKSRGTYCYKKLAFGYKDSPAEYARILDDCLRKVDDGLTRAKLKSFMDDLVGGGLSVADLTELLVRLFARLRQYNIQLNAKKSNFFCKSVDFCGSQIDKNGYALSEKRVAIMREYPNPDVECKDKKKLIRNVGFWGWHRWLIKDYSKYERKYRDLWNGFQEIKSGLKGSDREREAMKVNLNRKEITDHFKNTLSEQMMVFVNKQDTTHLTVDASDDAYGYTLYSERGMIAYGGSCFNRSEKLSHSTFEKEVLGVSRAMKDLYGLLTQCGKLIIHCDNLAAVLSVSQGENELTARVLKYIINIQMCMRNLEDAKIVHIKGVDNCLSDALSRLGEGNYINSITQIDGSKLAWIKSLHENTHWSVKKMIDNLKTLKIDIDRAAVEQVFRDCTCCGKLKKVTPKSVLKFHATPNRPLESIAIDHVVYKSRTSSQGHVGLITVRDQLTRYFFAKPVKGFGIETVVEYLEQIMNISGFRIREIYGDHAFMTKHMENFAARNGIKLVARPAHLSRSNIVERVHRDWHDYVKKFEGSGPTNRWHEVAGKIVRAINSSVSEAHGFTPEYLFPDRIERI